MLKSTKFTRRSLFKSAVFREETPINWSFQILKSSLSTILSPFKSPTRGVGVGVKVGATGVVVGGIGVDVGIGDGIRVGLGVASGTEVGTGEAVGGGIEQIVLVNAPSDLQPSNAGSPSGWGVLGHTGIVSILRLSHECESPCEL